MSDSENFEGRDVGSGISVIRESTDVVGSGPRLHRHPYTETFVIIRGRARFTVGDAERDGGAGDVLVVPAGTPHKFAVLGPGVYEAVHIHESDHFITEWLE
ncbi:cupin domain-containing protein [Amycolatopsis sp. NPDC049691]|uniref:cupin domain-containing protein n=1 Tax=Amycolatopsis sp. NPDC049691 TaxID=3155155 RepID=UPI003420CEAC